MCDSPHSPDGSTPGSGVIGRYKAVTPSSELIKEEAPFLQDPSTQGSFQACWWSPRLLCTALSYGLGGCNSSYALG